MLVRIWLVFSKSVQWALYRSCLFQPRQTGERSSTSGCSDSSTTTAVLLSRSPLTPPHTHVLDRHGLSRLCHDVRPGVECHCGWHIVRGGGDNELSQPVSGCHTWSSIIVCRVGMRYQCVTRAVMVLVDVMVV